MPKDGPSIGPRDGRTDHNQGGLYVAATRGRESNRLYVDTAYDPDPQTGHEWTAPPQTAHEVLAGVLANQGAELAAHDQAPPHGGTSLVVCRLSRTLDT